MRSQSATRLYLLCATLDKTIDSKLDQQVFYIVGRIPFLTVKKTMNVMISWIIWLHSLQWLVKNSQKQ